jgi:DNA-binding NarL/FixJ family response regulator
LLCVGTSLAVEVRDQLEALSRRNELTPILILSQPEDFKRFITILPDRVRAYVPSNASLDVVMEAIDIVTRGGMLLPPSCLSSLGRMVSEPCMVSASGVTFTGREYAVLRSLRQGKSNKCIAYDLNMSESTVKVHVRNIMKKLRARNRTEVAFLTQTMFNISLNESSYLFRGGKPTSPNPICDVVSLRGNQGQERPPR